MNKMKVLVALSSGKDSHASLIWAVNKYGKDLVKAVFCDTQWEHAILYPFIQKICDDLSVELVTLQSEYSFVELALKKGRFPSTKAKFCTQKLKVEPMIDYVISQLEQYRYVLIVQGIRKDESASRSKMEAQCSYFKYYFEPYGHDKNGKPKYFNYRKQDIIKINAHGRCDIERPVFNNTASEVITQILEAGHKPNPLYYSGVGRVGCFPCIMVTHWELWIIISKFPDYAERLLNAERLLCRAAGETHFFSSRLYTGKIRRPARRKGQQVRISTKGI